MPQAAAHLSDGWCGVDPCLRFDLIVSNPPVHTGIADDMAVVIDLVRGAATRLAASGVLSIIAQTQVPVGSILAAHGFSASFDDCDGGHFLCWRAELRGAPHAVAAAATVGAPSVSAQQGWGQKEKNKSKSKKMIKEKKKKKKKKK
eukprot:SAG11_NODE_4689_length_1805_cov_1.555100_1_plen_145_part_10